jgi:cellulose biosynthesis protein BcsQ
MKKVGVLSLKGGVGKTPFSLSLALDLDLYLQSNETSVGVSFHPERILVSDKVTLIDDCVYDFGGFADSGVLSIIKECNVVIIPCVPNYNSILKTIQTIAEIEEINKNIIILATNIKEPKDVDLIKDTLNENYSYLKYFTFKHSKIIENIINTGKSINQLWGETPLSKLSYARFHIEYAALLEEIKKA